MTTRRRAAMAACAAVYVLLVCDVVLGGPLSRADHRAVWLTEHVREPWLSAALAFSVLASWPVMWLLALGALLLLRVQRRWRDLKRCLASVLCVALVCESTRAVVRRPRPPLQIYHEPFASFPSGHAADALLASVLLLALFMGGAPRWARLVVAAAAAVYTLGVGASRVYLGLHFPTDVLAGYCVGAMVSLWVARS